MATKTIAGLTAGVAGDFDDTALFPVRNNDSVDRKYTLAQVRTAINTGAQVFTAGATFAGAISGVTTFGCGAITSTGKITVTLTTEQARFAYDSLNYCTITVAADGTTTFDSVDDGSTGAFVFSDGVTFSQAVIFSSSINVATTITTIAGGITAVNTSGALFSAQYDGSNRMDITVSSTGLTTFTTVGTADSVAFVVNGVTPLSFSDTLVLIGVAADFSGTIKASALPTSAGASGTLWVDTGASNVVKRVA